MKKIRSILLSLFFLIIAAVSHAQSGTGSDEKIQMAEGMRASGKIYVVVAVVMVILAGLIIYVIQLDRKIRKLEKEIR